MTDSPLVLCVMLAAGRQEMVSRSVRSFKAQTYRNKILLVLDNGAAPVEVATSATIRWVWAQPGKPIGTLRNLANSLATGGALDAPLIAHWDSDDWSHPERLTEQVALLERTKVHAVGYRDMVFYQTAPGQFCGAWLYTAQHPLYMVGTSMLYTRAIWEKFPFPEVATGEDTIWQNEKRIKKVSMSSLDPVGPPMMIASVHGGNTHAKIEPGRKEWRRAPEYDDCCRENML